MSLQSPAVDLTTCDREPIHIPGSIQEHGVLLTAAVDGGAVLQAAGDTLGRFGRAHDDCIGQPVERIIGSAAVASLREAANTSMLEPLYLGSYAAAGGTEMLDLVAHKRDGVLIMEFETSPTAPATAAQTLSTVRRITAKLASMSDLKRLLHAAAAEFRSATGFDRVMIYKFLEDGAGCVAAEDKLDALPPFLNHHYPASDIPKQARALYLQNLIRVIPDARYTPQPLVPPLNPVTQGPLDMSDCALRSVSPIHLQYLKNMGVTASMSVSLVVDGELWGLISCHHETPKAVPYELREICKLLGELLSQQIKAHEEAEGARQAGLLSAARDELVELLSQRNSGADALIDFAAELHRLIPADGAAVLVGSALTRHGHAPSEDDVRRLAEWLLESVSLAPFSTRSLPQDYAPGIAFASHASGVIATVVSREEPILLMWFRAEHIETIEWAGNPHKPVQAAEDSGLLTPRKSFEAWKETVRNRSRPWSRAEINAAHRIGRGVLEVVQARRLGELNVQLRRSIGDKEALIAQKDLLMQEVNHRVQNSLQLVNSMLHLQGQQSSDPEVRAQFEEASRRIMAVSTVHRRLWRRSDQIESVDFGTYLEELRDDLLDTWGQAWAGHISINARHLLVPTDKAIILALVVSELLTNAVKYAYDGKPGRVDIHVRQDNRGNLNINVRDEGVGIQGSAASQGGLGSRLIRALVRQVGGELSVSAASPGTLAALVVPC